MLLAMEKNIRKMQEAEDAQAGKMRYKRSGYSILELSLYLIGVMFFMAAAFFSWPTIRDFFRSGSQRMELNNMQSAATSYMSLRLDGSALSSAADLINGIEAASAVDGQKHDGFMSANSSRWKNGKYTDAWGEDFVFATESDGSHSITSKGPDKVAGTDDDIKVYY